jgi:hypothetical protein
MAANLREKSKLIIDASIGELSNHVQRIWWMVGGGGSAVLEYHAIPCNILDVFATKCFFTGPSAVTEGFCVPVVVMKGTHLVKAIQ